MPRYPAPSLGFQRDRFAHAPLVLFSRQNGKWATGSGALSLKRAVARFFAVYVATSLLANLNWRYAATAIALVGIP
jgi:hypothetical protein